MLLPILSSRRGFTLVELLIGMTIFAVGMTAILAMLHSAISSSIRSREEIVAANLLREQVELIKNVRNTNIRSFAPWDKIVSDSPQELTNGVFLIENNFAQSMTSYNAGNIALSPVSIKTATFLESDTDSIKFGGSRLYLDAKGRFTHDGTVPNTETKYASYLILSPVSFNDKMGATISPKYSDNSIYAGNDKYQGYVLDARVIARSGGQYHMYDLKTVITDWQK